MQDQEASRSAATVTHRLPGRTRLRIPAHRGDAGFFAQAVEQARVLPTVRAAQANPVTGSLLLEHEGEIEPIARELGLDVLTSQPPARRMRRPVAPPSPFGLAAVGFGAAAAVQLARGRLAGDSAVENLWNGFTAFRALKRPGLAAVLTGVGMVQLARGRVLNSALSLAFYAASARALARRQ
jgi:hypothetical protein